jgi:neutral ceramidase
LGFIAETYNAIVNGITQSIVNAHNSMFTGRIFVTETDVANAGVNRSPKVNKNYESNSKLIHNEYSRHTSTTLKLNETDSEKTLTEQ